MVAKKAPAKKRAKAAPTIIPTKIRVLRSVNLCDGPSLWPAIQAKRAAKESSDNEPYGFYVALRLFATKSMIQEYLAGPELASYCASTSTELPILNDEDPVITEENFMSESSALITKQEYAKTLRIQDDTLDDLEELVCELRGIDSLESLEKPKRLRRKKKEVVVEEPVVVSAPPVERAPEEPVNSDEEEEVVVATTTASERPSVVEEKAKAPKKRKKVTLRDQFVQVKDTPSRVIDVSDYMKSMQHQKGRVLDRVRHGERIAKCTSLSNLFPIISDNLQAFERAMNTLGSRYASRVVEFREVHGQKLKETLGA